MALETQSQQDKRQTLRPASYRALNISTALRRDGQWFIMFIIAQSSRLQINLNRPSRTLDVTENWPTVVSVGTRVVKRAYTRNITNKKIAPKNLKQRL